MGPGRRGSSSIDLGVNVSYADINKTRVLVEMAREEAGHAPEVAYGTHFFQDLVEDEIVYLPELNPDDIEAQFNDKFFGGAANSAPRTASGRQGIRRVGPGGRRPGAYGRIAGPT